MMYDTHGDAYAIKCVHVRDGKVIYMISKSLKHGYRLLFGGEEVNYVSADCHLEELEYDLKLVPKREIVTKRRVLCAE
jgi:hypothetical protein